MTPIHYQQGFPRAGAHGAGDGWLAAVCDNRLLLVQSPPASDAGTRADALWADALWASINSAHGIQAVLDELTRGGMSATPSFALAEWESGLGSVPATVRAIIRGDVRLVVRAAEGTVAKDASGVSTWLEHEYPRVVGFDVEVSKAKNKAGDASLLPPLPLVAGMAWVSAVTVGKSDIDAKAVAQPNVAAQPAGGPAIDPTATAAATPAAVELPDATPAKSPEEPSAPAAPSAWIDPEATVAELTVSPEAALLSAGPSASQTDVAADGSYDYLFGETVFRTVEDAAVREEDGPPSDPAAPAASPDASVAGQFDAGDHDGHTIASSDIAKLRAGRKARAASAASAAAPPVGPNLYLELANGSREPLSQPILVGRAPSVSKVSGGQIPRLLTIAGPDQDISRNHAQFAVAGGTVVVTDLHSRNGTLVVLPGRPPQQLRQGEPTSVIVGTIVDLGGGVTFTVCEE